VAHKTACIFSHQSKCRNIVAAGAQTINEILFVAGRDFGRLKSDPDQIINCREVGLLLRAQHRTFFFWHFDFPFGRVNHTITNISAPDEAGGYDMIGAKFE
jgi:hypothetical protein